jgi:lipopolysaccharide/colanic/teichoic acid biosynthesis glycosyltransferase
MGERTRELAVLILGDAGVFIFSLWLTLVVRYLALPNEDIFFSHLVPFSILTAVWVLVFFVGGLYDKQTVFLKTNLIKRIINTQIANSVVAALLFLIIPFGIAPKTNLVIYLVISTILLSWWRLALYKKIEPKTKHRAILLADGPAAIELVDETNNNDRYSYTYVRIIDEATAKGTENFDEKLLKLIEKERIDIVVASPGNTYVAAVLPKIFDLSFLRFEATFLDFYKVYEDTFDRVPVSSITYEWFITNISQKSNAVYDAAKRAIDIVGAVVLLIPCIFIFPAVALLTRLTDRGPLLYRTVRIGQFGKPVTILKFRTMTGMDQGNEGLATKHTVTKLGAILRKSRIDELPQLINVLKGELSFIGPRPEMPALVAEYANSVPYYNARHYMKPGLSGWAQINNFEVPRGGIDVERTKIKVSYDLYYLEHRSFFLDMQIALKTLAALLMRTGT